MDGLFLILFLLSPVALVIGLVRPSVYSKIFKGKLSRKNIGLAFGGLMFASFILFGVTSDSTPPDKESELVSSEEIIEKVEKSQTLGEITEEIEAPKQDLIKVTRVIDGDTIEIEGGQKIRYIGIDTPETVHPNEPVGCYGKEASDKNTGLVLNKEVRLEKDVSETDKYGRLLRYVWIEDLMVNEYLVREGFAVSSSYPPDIKYQERFVEAQRKAREKGKGLWSSYCDDWGEPTSTPVSVISKPTNTPPVYIPQPTSPPPVKPITGSSYTCNCSKTCSNMSSCEEAYFQLNDCGCTIRDGDDDGVPCEIICPGG